MASMLTPFSASTWNIFEATPACERMPMPTTEIFATSEETAISS